MPMDYRVSLDCGHTLNYRTTVHPMRRKRLTCIHCGPHQRALTAVQLRTGARVFDSFRAAPLAGSGRAAS